MRGTPRRGLAGTALALALLAGCAAPPPDPTPAAAAPAVAPTPAPAPVVSAPEVKPAPEPVAQPVAQPAAQPVALPAAPPPRRIAAVDLVGLERDRLADLFGAPALRRRETPAEVWQYGNGRCALFVFLYPDRDRLKVRHAETAARGASPLKSDTDCIEALLKPGVRPPAFGTAAGEPAS